MYGQLWQAPMQEISQIMHQGDVKTAEKYINELTHEFPEDVALRLQIAHVYHDAQNPIQAIQYCKWILKQKNVIYVDAAILKWSIENELAKHKSALKTMRKAIKIEPNNPVLYFNSALSNIQIGKEDRAIVQLLQTIEQEINFTNGHYYLALSQIERAEKKKAVESSIFYMYLSSDTEKCTQLLINLNELFLIPFDENQEDEIAIDKAIYDFYFEHYFSKRKNWDGLPRFMVREMEKSLEYKLWMQNYILRLNRLGEEQYTATFLHCALAQANNHFSKNWMTNNEQLVFDFFKWVEAGNL